LQGFLNELQGLDFVSVGIEFQVFTPWYLVHPCSLFEQ